MKPTRRWRMVAVAAVVTVGAAAGLATTRPSVAASTFESTAAAEVVRVVVRAQPAIIAEDLLDPGAITAQASLNSLPESLAYAAHPYPGAVPLSAPGLVDGLTAGATDLPDYPLVAAANYPSTPSAHAGAGPVELTAETRRTDAKGAASDGGNRAEASVTLDQSTDNVIASASSTVANADFGGFLSLAGVRSEAVVTKSPAGELTRQTSFTAARIVVLGQSAQLTEDGLELAGQTAPLGLDAAGNALAPLLDQLAGNGITVRYLEPIETADGIVSAALEVSREIPAGSTTATLVYTFGRTFASVANRARTVAATPTTSFSGSGGGALPGPAASPPNFGSSSATPGAAAPSTGSSGGVLGTDDLSGARQALLAERPDVTQVDSFYAVLFGAGSVLVLVLTLFRYLGVKLRWIS